MMARELLFSEGPLSVKSEIGVRPESTYRLASAHPRLREGDDQVDQRRATEFRAFCYWACDRFVRMGKAI